jgi:hypothetical protein
MNQFARILPFATVALLVGTVAQAQVPALNDPGTGPWEMVDEDDVAEDCRLDRGLLENAMIPAMASFAVVRYGRLCFVSGPDNTAGTLVTHNWSATKTLGALLTGAAIYQTRHLPQSDAPRTGRFTEWDRMDKWLDLTTLPERADIHPDATVAHVLAMVGYNDDLSYGAKTHRYDAGGEREINYLIEVILLIFASPRRTFARARTSTLSTSYSWTSTAMV